MARRTKVGSQVKVVGSHYPELLVDMGLLGPDKQARNDVWMHGTVISGSSHHWLVKLPGAKAELQFPKEKVLDKIVYALTEELRYISHNIFSLSNVVHARELRLPLWGFVLRH